MKQPKRHIYLDDYEWHVVINGMNEFRNQLIREGRNADPVSEVLLKTLDAPTKRLRIIREET